MREESGLKKLGTILGICASIIVILAFFEIKSCSDLTNQKTQEPKQKTKEPPVPQPVWH